MGSGGGNYFPKASDDLRRLVQESKEEATKERLAAEVNALLRETLAIFERDPEKAQAFLGSIRKALNPETEMLDFMFGGSVAKHTFVDGLSDVDSLVILKKDDYVDKEPEEVLEAFYDTLKSNLKKGKVESIQKGKLAVTVTFSGGIEIQLLPALKEGKAVLIGNSTGKDWMEIYPKHFQKALSTANERLSNVLIPVIKLFKSINAGLAEQKQLTGYHIESLSLEAVKGYRRNKTVREVLLQVLQASSTRVLEPITDITGQSRIVDEYLGGTHSPRRKVVADALESVVRKLLSAKSVETWKEIIIG